MQCLCCQPFWAFKPKAMCQEVLALSIWWWLFSYGHKFEQCHWSNIFWRPVHRRITPWYLELSAVFQLCMMLARHVLLRSISCLLRMVHHIPSSSTRLQTWDMGAHSSFCVEIIHIMKWNGYQGLEYHKQFNWLFDLICFRAYICIKLQISWPFSIGLGTRWVCTDVRVEIFESCMHSVIHSNYEIRW